MLFAGVLSFIGDVICCVSKLWRTLACGVCTDGVCTGCVRSVTGGVLTGGVVSCIGMVSVIAPGRLVEMLAFIVSLEICASSDGYRCEVSQN